MIIIIKSVNFCVLSHDQLLSNICLEFNKVWLSQTTYRVYIGKRVLSLPGIVNSSDFYFCISLIFTWNWRWWSNWCSSWRNYNKKIIKALKKHEHSRQSQNLSWFFKELLKRLLMLSYIPSVQALTSVFLTEVWTSELVLVTTILTFLPGTPLNVAVTGVSPTVVTGLVYQIHEN